MIGRLSMARMSANTNEHDPIGDKETSNSLPVPQNKALQQEHVGDVPDAGPDRVSQANFPCAFPRLAP